MVFVLFLFVRLILMCFFNQPSMLTLKAEPTSEGEGTDAEGQVRQSLGAVDMETNSLTGLS